MAANPLSVPASPPSPNPRTYISSRLIGFGPVCRRTLGGAGTMMEGMAMISMNRFP